MEGNLLSLIMKVCKWMTNMFLLPITCISYQYSSTLFFLILVSSIVPLHYLFYFLLLHFHVDC